VPASFAVVAVVVIGAAAGVSAWAGLNSSDALAATWSYTNWHAVAGGESELLRTIVGPFGPFWSLAIEEQFYVLLALGFVVLRVTQRPHRWLGGALAAAWLTSLVFGLFVPMAQYRAEFGLDTRAGEIAIGALAALVLRRRPGLIEGRARSLDRAGWVALGGIVLLMMVADYDPPWLLRGGYPFVALLHLAVVLAVLSGATLAQALSAPALVALGRISYSLYLVHWPLILLVSQQGWGASGLDAIAVKVAASLAAAVVLHVLVEQPCRRRFADRLFLGGWLVAGAALSIFAFIAL